MYNKGSAISSGKLTSNEKAHLFFITLDKIDFCIYVNTNRSRMIVHNTQFITDTCSVRYTTSALLVKHLIKKFRKAVYYTVVCVLHLTMVKNCIYNF